MSDPYIGEIRMFGGNFAPVGWALCQGQLLSIAEYDALFALIGTTYGGDGQETFGLPDLQGRVPMHQGGSFVIGERAGSESVTLTTGSMPSHGHPMLSTGQPGTSATPANAIMADEGPGTPAIPAYLPFDGTSQIAISPSTVGPAGGSQPHDNIQPYLAVTFIISLAGIFPPQS